MLCFNASVLGALYTAVGIAALVGPPTAGVFFDWAGDYRASMLVSLATAAIAGWLVTTLAGASKASANVRTDG